MLTLKRMLGETLPNKCTIIAITPLSEVEAVVIAITNGQSGHAYATWFMRLSDNQCFHGDYCHTLTEAFESYTARGGR